MLLPYRDKNNDSYEILPVITAEEILDGVATPTHHVFVGAGSS